MHTNTLNMNTNQTSSSHPCFQTLSLTHTTFTSALSHTCGSSQSQWSHISFIKIYFTGTACWVQPVSISPQQTRPGPFITIKEVQGAQDRCWNLLVEETVYFDIKHHHYQYSAPGLKYLWCFKELIMQRTAEPERVRRPLSQSALVQTFILYPLNHKHKTHGKYLIAA